VITAVDTNVLLDLLVSGAPHHRDTKLGESNDLRHIRRELSHAAAV
jgi:hypothetical protein